MIILMNTGGIATTNCFVVADEQARQAVLFDAPDHTTAPLLDQIEKRGWNLIGLWLTHGHFDHVADHALVTSRFPDVKIFIHPLDEPKLIQPNTRFFPLPFVIPSRKADGYLEDGQNLSIGSLQARVIHTPGHSPGHVMFHFHSPASGLPVLIGGDLIIMGAVGRTDFPDSDAAALDESIRRVMQLPGQTRLMPGHGRPSTLKEEKRNNRYVQLSLSSE